MSRDGSGTYTRPNNSFTQPVTGTAISSTHADAFFDDLETELTDSLSRSGKGGMSADLDMNSNDVNEVRTVELVEIASPSNPAADRIVLFAKDVASATHLFTRDSAGTEVDITAAIAGAGVSSIDTIAGAFTTDDSLQATSNVLRATFRGHIYGLTLSNNASDATNDIDIAAGEAAEDSGGILMKLSSTLTKRLDASWAVGTGNGGLDTGSIANDTYHVWLIQRSDTGVVDALFSTSPTSPTMPTNYDRKRRIGSIIRSGATILSFTQFGNEFLLNAHVENVAGTSDGVTTAVLGAVTVPTDIQVIAILSGYVVYGSATAYGLLTSPDQTDQAASASNFNSFASATSAILPFYAQIRTNTSGQIRRRISHSSGGWSIVTRGWIDAL